MPTYTADVYLTKGNQIIKPGQEVELTEEQAARLGDKLVDAPGKDTTNEGGDGEYTEASLKKLSADEQKAIVEQLGGNLEEVTNEEKRVAYILENQ